jgi:hypothetical protein
MGTVPTIHWVFTGYRTHYEGKTPNHTLDSWCPNTQKSKCGGSWWANHCKTYSRSILVCRRISSGLLIKKKTNKKKRVKKREGEKNDETKKR